VDVDILGPLSVRDRDGRELRLPAGRELSLFALLLIHRDEVVSTDRIVEVLWGNRPPETAGKAVQGYVSHLRRVLEPGDERELLVTRAPGYVLRAEAITVDAKRFEQLAADARRALDDGSPEDAAPLFDEALALWRGPALAEFAYDDFAQAEIHRLGELRLAVTEDRVDVLLQLGRHAELVGQLDALVAAHPLRERLRGQWMLALYRSGRQAEALQAYRDGRRLLAGELGLEPGPELQRLERAILAQDPTLEAVPPAVRSAPVGAGQPTRRLTPRRVAVGAVLVSAAIAAAVLVVLRATDDGPARVTIRTPALVAIDPATNRVVASIPVGSKPVAVAVGYGSVWVGDAADGTVTRVDEATRKAVRTIGIAAPAIDLATGAGSVWAATGGFGTVVRIDPTVDRVVRRIDLAAKDDPAVPPVSAVAVRDGHLWVGAFDGMAEIDPRSDRIVRRIDLGKSAALQIAPGRDSVWASLDTRYARAVDVSSTRRTANFYAGTAVFAIARDDDAVWLAGVFGGQLWEIDPTTAATIRTGNAGKGANGVALGFGGVWIASWPDHTLVRVDPATGDVRATIPLGGEPEDVAIGDGLVWVVVQRAPLNN
jgi:DNA-binding SARP family transcriptional activator/DNA-binding beta-propeller fold protein YncE